MKKRINRVYLLTAIMQSVAAGWFFCTYVLFLEASGLTSLHSHFLNAIYMSSNTLLEPFTGQIADRFGQKPVFLCGQFICGVGLLIYGLGGGFIAFALAEITSALGSALISNSLECILRNLTDRDNSHRTISRGHKLTRLAAIPSAVLGGVIGAHWGLEWPWLIGSLTSFLSFGIALPLLRTVPDYRANPEGKINLSNIGALFSQCWQIHELRRVFLVVLASAAAFMPLNMLWPLILRDASGSTNWLGILWIGIAVFSALGAELSERGFLRPGLNGISLALIAIGLPLSLTPFPKNAVLLTAIFLLHEIGRGALRPLIFTFTNDFFPDEIRSSANGVISTLRWVGNALGLIVSGLLTTLIGPKIIWGLAGVTFLFTASTLYQQRNRAHKKVEF